VHIFFRSCDRVLSFHGGGRVVDASKVDIALNCLQSVIDSMAVAKNRMPDWTFDLTIVDDHSSALTLAEMQRLLQSGAIGGHIMPVQDGVGNSASLQANYALAQQVVADLLYFVEDDYLHDSAALFEMVEAYRRLSAGAGQDIIIHPCDYPDRYRNPYPSRIVL